MPPECRRDGAGTYIREKEGKNERRKVSLFRSLVTKERKIDRQIDR